MYIQHDRQYVQKASYYLSAHEQRICTYRGLGTLGKPHHRTAIQPMDHISNNHPYLVNLNCKGKWAKEPGHNEITTQCPHIYEWITDLTSYDMVLHWLHTGGYTYGNHSDCSIYFPALQARMELQLSPFCLWCNVGCGPVDTNYWS